MWLDWTESGAGPAAFDLSMWLYGSAVGAGFDEPRGSARRLPGGAHHAGGAPRVQARGGRVRVLGFLLTQLARLTDREPDLIERVIERAEPASRSGSSTRLDTLGRLAVEAPPQRGEACSCCPDR